MSIVIKQSEMPINMKDYAIGVAKRAFDLYKEEWLDIAKYIVENFEGKYGGQWNCFVGKFASYSYPPKGRSIRFDVEGVKVTLWKSR